MSNSKPASMEAFFTRPAANLGIELPLYTPDGQPSGHTLTVLGVDSDTFRRTETEVMRKGIEIAQMPEGAERTEAFEHQQVRLISCLISAWTLEEECSEDNKIVFLKNAPQIRDAIDKVAVQRKHFLGLASKDSSPSQKGSSGSTKRQKAPNKHSGPASTKSGKR
jgi:hypothetical protein